MEEPRLIAATVVWNHRDRLPLLLRSLDDQTRRPDQTILIDAASHDGVSTWLAQTYPYVSSLRLFQHHGLGHAWRQAAKFALQRVSPQELGRTWIFFVSPETLLAKNVCERLLQEAVKDPNVGALGPAVLRAWYLGEGDDGLEQIEPTELVESLGLQPLKSFSWRPHGQGESLRMHETAMIEVFALPPVAVLYRADALTKLLELEGLSLPWNTVDALFFDLGWRMRWLGLEARLLPDVFAWRVERKGDGHKVTSWTERLGREQDRQQLVKLHLLGVGIRLRTLPARAWATLRIWPYRFWGLFAHRREYPPYAGDHTRQVARRVLGAQREAARSVLRQWLFLKPLTKVKKPLNSESSSTSDPKE